MNKLFKQSSSSHPITIFDTRSLRSRWTPTRHRRNRPGSRQKREQLQYPTYRNLTVFQSCQAPPQSRPARSAALTGRAGAGPIEQDLSAAPPASKPAAGCATVVAFRLRRRESVRIAAGSESGSRSADWPFPAENGRLPQILESRRIEAGRRCSIGYEQFGCGTHQCSDKAEQFGCRRPTNCRDSTSVKFFELLVNLVQSQPPSNRSCCLPELKPIPAPRQAPSPDQPLAPSNCIGSLPRPLR